MASKTKQLRPLTDEEIDKYHKAAEKGNIAAIEILRSELDTIYSGVLNSEISELERISEFTESVAQKLQNHYAEIFPKRCNSCGEIYQTREDFIRATHGLKTIDTVFDEIGLQEYRNCPCGSTLIVWTRDRRDSSEYGKARRKLFNDCVQKLKTLTDEDEKTIQAKLRTIFSAMS